ncbi:MAG: 30S ribosomal protein S4 [Methanocellales archaeon]
MGYPGKARKQYERPSHPWQISRITEEVELIKKYGLRNKRELWKAESILRKYRRKARELLAELSTAKGEQNTTAELESKNILAKLQRMGILKQNATLDDILALKVEDILERRLQTQVYRQGLARTIKQARQLIVHGHISVSRRKITIPSYMVPKVEETAISYSTGSPIKLETVQEVASASEKQAEAKEE